MRVAFGRFTFDTETRELLDAGARVHLSPKAFDLLALLLDRRPTVVSKREIHDHVWQDTFVSEANLSVVDRRDPPGARRRLPPGELRPHGAPRRLRVQRAGADARRRATGARTEERLCWLVRNDRAFPLVAGENVVGRDPRCDVWVEASGVSRRHACVDVGTDKTTIADLESSNGTFVAGERITEPRILADGDVIELGAATLTFRAWSDERAARTERVVRTPRET